MASRYASVSAFVVGVAIFIAMSGCQSSGAKGRDGAGGAGGGDAQKEISGLLDQYTQALLKKDVAALDRIWADDLTFVNARGELLSKQDRMANIKSGATAFKTIN